MNKPTLAEKLAVNLFTPLEAPFLYIFLRAVADDPSYTALAHTCARDGLIRSIWKTKVRDYERLIDHAKFNDTLSDRGLALYEGTLCGCLMVQTYRVFRGSAKNS